MDKRQHINAIVKKEKRRYFWEQWFVNKAAAEASPQQGLTCFSLVARNSNDGGKDQGGYIKTWSANWRFFM